jgi:hypothetical protein
LKKNLQNNNLSLYAVLHSELQLALITISLLRTNSDTSFLPDDLWLCQHSADIVEMFVSADCMTSDAANAEDY